MAPKWDEPGSVAIAGFETELVVEHVEITGRLDATWCAERARAIATSEASAFPAPKVAPPPQVPGVGAKTLRPGR